MSAPQMQTSIQEDKVSEEQQRTRVRMQNDQNRPPVDRLPMVTMLLRACRDGNEVLIKAALRDVIINGITKEQLNLTDKSGRTAISYICSNGLVQFLDILLQLPNIDVNKADNEGNTPLHFAAEAGRSDIINMMISRCRTLGINAKNHLGLTPLMKAALQGRTQSGKLILFGGADPLEIDPKRRMRADEWANFVGHFTCGETLLKVGKHHVETKLGGKWPTESSSSLLNKRIITRSNTTHLVSSPNNKDLNSSSNNVASPGGFRTKLRKILPFGMSLKDKTHGNNIAKNKRSETSDLVSYLSAAALCASTGPALAKDQTVFIKNLFNHQDVPKLEVTYASNNSLIKKLENSRYGETEPQSNNKSPSPVMVRIK